jgi:high-affinity nickel permease
MSLMSILTFGFFLGIKHSLEPEHVIAVATTAGKTKKVHTHRCLLGNWP